MKMLALQGILLICAVQLVALLVHQQRVLVWAAGIALAVPLLGLLRLLATPDSGSPDDAAIADEPGAALRRWLSATEAKIRWSESTRADWDRRWRPILAGRFEVSTGQGRAKDPAAFAATGEMLFGSELWPWVDPGNVAPAADRGPGPGSAVLEEILRRLEQR